MHHSMSCQNLTSHLNSLSALCTILCLVRPYLTFKLLICTVHHSMSCQALPNILIPYPHCAPFYVLSDLTSHLNPLSALCTILCLVRPYLTFKPLIGTVHHSMSCQNLPSHLNSLSALCTIICLVRPYLTFKPLICTVHHSMSCQTLPHI